MKNYIYLFLSVIFLSSCSGDMNNDSKAEVVEMKADINQSISKMKDADLPGAFEIYQSLQENILNFNYGDQQKINYLSFVILS